MTASFAEIDIHKYDHLPPEEAIRKAWFDEGSNVLSLARVHARSDKKANAFARTRN